MIGTVEAVCAIALLCTASYFDIRFRRIPNFLCYIGIVLGVVFGLVEQDFTGHILGMLAGGLPLLLLFYFGLVGGGDVKLMLATGAILGFPLILDVLTLSVGVGGLLALVMVVHNKTSNRKPDEAATSPPSGVPYAVPALIACLLTQSFDQLRLTWHFATT